MLAAVVVGAALLGLVVGSVLNVLIDRVPYKVPLRGPREGEPCPPVRWAGVPAQPFLLRGGGRDGVPLPRRWLWVELVTGLVFAVLAAAFGDSVDLVPMLVLGASLVTVSVIDLQLLRIPDRITFPTLAIAIPLIALIAVADDRSGSLRAGLLGAVVYFALLFVPHLIYPAGMGFGDVKLALLMGLYLGWQGWTPEAPAAGPFRLVLYALMLGCVLGVVFGLVTQVVTRRRGAFPFGPALALGCLVVLLFAVDLRY